MSSEGDEEYEDQVLQLVDVATKTVVDFVTRTSTDGHHYQCMSQAEKRRRKRRENIKDRFSSLRNSVPAINGKMAKNACEVLTNAAEYIRLLREMNGLQQKNFDDLQIQNTLLEAQITMLEQAKSAQVYQPDPFEDIESDVSDR